MTQISLNVPATGTYTVMVGSRISNLLTFLATGDYLLRVSSP